MKRYFVTSLSTVKQYLAFGPLTINIHLKKKKKEKAKGILEEHNHILSTEFTTTPSTNSYSKAFILFAIRLLNLGSGL